MGWVVGLMYSLRKLPTVWCLDEGYRGCIFKYINLFVYVYHGQEHGTKMEMGSYRVSRDNCQILYCGVLRL